MTASVHHLTPTLSVIGPRGEAVRQVEYLRTVAGEQVRALINRLQYDVVGHLVAQQDPRLPTPNTTTVFRLDGMAVKTRNVDGGEDTVLPGLGGELLQNWDANGNHREMSYDPQLRLRSVTENGVIGFETFSHETASADPTHNLRGQMTALSDPSGTVQFNSFNMRGQSTAEVRTFEDGKICTGRQRFSAIGVLLQTTDAGGHVQQSTFDIAGQLAQVHLQLSGQSVQPILNGADYNAAGRITEQRLGNGVTSHWHYREADGRLLRQYAQKASEPAVQDFEYEYDLVGNTICIVDHTYTPTFFRNQRVDGERTFGYDSVYRLTRATGYSDAPPADNPGRPQPTDPNDRRNYVESFEYDDGNNLKKLTHVRDGNTHTREMFIDPDSNRGVRWRARNPAPDFSALFDRAGNLLALQPGQPMHWNSRHQLESLILAEHASGPPDQELYHYSQGARAFKRHETHTSTVNHIAEVHYVGSLEIRTRSSGEELHRITVATGIGEVTCLHWVTGKPPGIDADRLCYSHSDHLGSSVTEIDQRAQVISRESYYAFGATSSMAARSQIEADYKFTRYSGKEMDVTGLYYYGARYYAPWLCRWVSADPSGDADGTNRYAFVGNNPIFYVDDTGNTKNEAGASGSTGDTGDGKKTAGYKLKRWAGHIKKAETAAGQMQNIASDFEKLVPEDADIEQVRKDLTFGKFIRSKYGRASMRKGLAVGATAGSAGAGVYIAATALTAPPAVAVAPIILAVSPIVGMVAVPVITYKHLKKGLNRADMLRRAEAANDSIALFGEVAGAVGNALGAAGDLYDQLNPEADKSPETKMTPEAAPATYVETLQELFYEQMKTLTPLQQAEVGKLVPGEGVPYFEALSQVLKAANEPSSSTRPTPEVSDPPQEKPTPMPMVNKPQLARRRLLATGL
ncbi:MULTISPECIES: RHS repeat-associated core domain-containing protein [unclassified Pseudomonas]|uniref:RHS repeat-associated core domain-containing protein n=1 Tax=unclassified Pseudomonas TaxID=196821 RepID=UPI000A1E43F6|nr:MULTISPECIES: RHS repeat-associated core domain-containing protein [unclassified Pseudomonas]